MKCFFDALNIYYIPQYKPVWEELCKRGHKCTLIVYNDKKEEVLIEKVLKTIIIPYVKVENKQEALDFYLTEKPNWIFFGNSFHNLDRIHRNSKTAQIGHGIGPKRSYYRKSDTPMFVRFIEGAKRLKVIQEMYPNDTFIQVGFSKLDPIFNGSEVGLDLKAKGLDPNKKTLLYAPTFNPSSIGCFPKKFPLDFEEYNIIIKAHSFTFSLSQSHYVNDRKRIQEWSKYDNVYVAQPDEYSLIPFLKSADLLISEASSTLFEFAALDKPVVICDFYHLKWSYRGIFKYRFKRRFLTESVHYQDLGAHAKSYKELKSVVLSELENPQRYASNREKYNEDHVGKTDGQVSVRIVDYLEEHS